MTKALVQVACGPQSRSPSYLRHLQYLSVSECLRTTHCTALRRWGGWSKALFSSGCLLVVETRRLAEGTRQKNSVFPLIFPLIVFTLSCWYDSQPSILMFWLSPQSLDFGAIQAGHRIIPTLVYTTWNFSETKDPTKMFLSNVGIQSSIFPWPCSIKTTRGKQKQKQKYGLYSWSSKEKQQSQCHIWAIVAFWAGLAEGPRVRMSAGRATRKHISTKQLFE